MTSSFMSLPDEIKLNILDSVNIGPENTHLELRRTHPWFRANICTETLRARLLAAEKDPKLVPPRHRVCYTCLRVLPADNFADNSTRTPKGLGGKQAHKRFCIDCGVRYGKYSPGSEVMAIALVTMMMTMMMFGRIAMAKSIIYDYGVDDDLSDEYLDRDSDM
ncbi:MAG: hypothetical protein LQ352_004611 [Teloschistes flavicans]|nr:MAG: hypothetical protein LQ352_004611 [Teloschistes flavicans]